MRQQDLSSPAIPYRPCTECKQHISECAVAYCSNDVNMRRKCECNNIESYHKEHNDNTHDKCYGFVHNVKCLSVNNHKKGVDDLLDA